jgi:predicted phage terminase large subunit-like protein
VQVLDFETLEREVLERFERRIKSNSNLPTPHPGPQTSFLNSKAKITGFGGGAGGGKTFASLLVAAKDVGTKGYNALVLRRERTQVTQQGGIWSASTNVYANIAQSNQTMLRWNWKTGGTVAFSGLEHENDKYKYQGAELTRLIFDEGTHFSSTQFWYLFSRLRTTSGLGPQAYLTMNPDPDSWLAEFFAWWIDEDGYAIPERDGVLRWVVRDGNNFIWFDSQKQAQESYPDREENEYVSVTFIRSKLEDNPSLAGTGYRGNLMMQDAVEQARLLDGNWKVRAANGDYFPIQFNNVIDNPPSDIVRKVRSWDFGGTNDWTVGVLLGLTSHQKLIVLDVIRWKKSVNPAMDNDTLLESTARDDGKSVMITIPQDPGEAGKTLAATRVANLIGFDVEIIRPTGEKTTRATSFSRQWKAGNVSVVRNSNTRAYLDVMNGFGPDSTRDDDVDCSSDACNKFGLFVPHVPLGDTGNPWS